MSDKTDKQSANTDDVYLKSMFYEQLVEHVFVSEVLQEVWYYFGATVEVRTLREENVSFPLPKELRVVGMGA